MTDPRRPLPPELRDALAERAEGAELAQIWDLLALADPAGPASVAGAATPAPAASALGTAWARVSTRLHTARPRLTPVTPAAPVVTRPTRWRRTAGTALAATLAIAAGIGAWRARPVTVGATLGAQQTHTLPDGSVVELNAGSTLTYAGGFRSRLGLPAATRVVRLQGEAFFSVQRSARPFEVITREARVTVLGTRFLVRARADEAEGTQVAVESGRVRVAARDAATDTERSVELSAGQGTRVAPNAVPSPVAPVGVAQLTRWRRGGLAFVDQPLAAIVRELERRYAVEIRLHATPAPDERITYYASQPSLETVLSDLCTPRGLRFSRTSRGFEIRPVLEASPATP